jgi:hypothetical protein
LKRRLKEYAGENSFATVLEAVPSGGRGSDQQLDLVLRPSGMLAVTTGYVFLPVVSPEHMARLGVELDEDTFVEQAYLVGAVAEDRTLAAGDDRLKALSSRFELAPELWQVLSEDLGWNDVEPVAPAMGAGDGREG